MAVGVEEDIVPETKNKSLRIDLVKLLCQVLGGPIIVFRVESHEPFEDLGLDGQALGVMSVQVVQCLDLLRAQ